MGSLSEGPCDEASPSPGALRRIARALPIPVVLFDDALRPLWMNAGAEAAGARLAASAPELLGGLVPDPAPRARILASLRARCAERRVLAPERIGLSVVSTPRPGVQMLALDGRPDPHPDAESDAEDLRQLVDASRDVFARFDRRGRLLRVNEAVSAMCGWHPDELVGRPLGAFVSRLSRASLRAALPLLRDEGQLENLELELRRADGALATVIAHVSLVRGDRGATEGAVAVLRDITGRKALQERVLEADRLAVTGKLAARIAHEINNPLQALVMHMSIVGPEIPPEVELVDSWERMRQAAKQIQRIVSDLLDLREGREPDAGPADLNEVVEEALSLTRKSLALRRIELSQTLERNLPGVTLRHRQLRQVTLNLVLHAMDGMREGGRLTLRTRSVAGGREVRLDVRDTGPPIAPERLAQLFDPHPRDGDGGAGLGLFVAHTLVRAAGGRVSVDSRAGQGTCVSVFLPLEGSR